MARSRLRQTLLWGLLLLPLMCLPAAVLVGRAWVDRTLHGELTIGGYALRFASPRLEWDLRFHADSLRVDGKGLRAMAGPVSAEVRIWQSLVNLSPSFRASVDTLVLDLAPSVPRPRDSHPRRLRTDKGPAFPNLRIPVPLLLEAGMVTVRRDGHALTRFAGLRVYSQGARSAAVEWDGARLASPPRRVAAQVAAKSDSVLVLGPFRASARWFGRRVRYQARFDLRPGDFIRVEGERRKTNLSMGRDTVEGFLADLSAYASLFPSGSAPEIASLSLKASLGIDPGLVLDGTLAARVPGPLKLGPQALTLRMSVRDSTGSLALDGRGDGGEDIRLAGGFRFPGIDSLDLDALARGFTGDFTGHTRDVRLRLGKKVLPADVLIRDLSVSGGEALARVRTRDSSELDVRIYRDSSGATGWSSWRFSFKGWGSPTERWAHAWTKDTNIVFRSAWLEGIFQPGELTVEVWGKDVRAYGAVADSLWARNIIRRRGYYLDDSRLYWNGLTWPVKGRVEWTGPKPYRGPRGLKMRREVSLSFRAEHPRHGSLEFAMPRRGALAVTTDSLELERLPIPRLAPVRPFHPVATGRFAWDWEARDGETSARAFFLYGGERLAVDLQADWDREHLMVSGLELALRDSRLRLGADLRLRGRQFHQVRGLGPQDIRMLSLEARRFEPARLASMLGRSSPLERGMLDGRLTYDDTLGFRGFYDVRDLRLAPLSPLLDIPRITLSGQGRDLLVSARSASAKQPWLNDTVSLLIEDLLGNSPGIRLRAAADPGAALVFEGRMPEKRILEGSFRVEGNALLPGGAGTMRDARLRGRVSAPLDKNFIAGLKVDSVAMEGRYVVQGMDTQIVRGEAEIQGGRLRMPRFSAVDQSGRTLTGEAELRLGKPLMGTALIRGEALALQLEGLQQMVFQDVEANLFADSSGLAASARASRASFRGARGAVTARGNLENLHASFVKARAAGGRESVPKVGLKARMRNFTFKHEIGFRDVQRFFRTVKVEKRKKRRRPMDLDISLEAVGAENRIETGILRMYFTGDLALKGVYPNTLLNGEISALSGEVGQTSQSYGLQDFSLRWQNATMEEGRVVVEGAKKLRVDCLPETERTCNVYIKLEGRLDEMAFTYDSDCGQTAGGEVIEPAALINSVSRGCYSGDYVSGAGGGGYGEAVFTFLEPTISQTLTRRMSQMSRGWIKSTQVSGIGTMVSRDTAGISEPISLGVETKEKWGVKGMARAGYHPEKKVSTPWENKVAVEWRPPIDKVARGSEWKRRVRDRVTLEASAETRPEQKLEEEDEREVRLQGGIRFRYKFWNLW